MLDRDVEESLDLRGMQINRHEVSKAGSLDTAGNHARRDGLSAVMAFVRTRVTEIGNHGGDMTG